MATMEELADKVAHATTGKEVRGAIAEGFGHIAALEDDNSALNRRVDELGERITALEDMLFGQHPQEVKMAENSTPPVNGGAMLINLTSKEDK